MKRRRDAERGFTLAELLVVVAIFAIALLVTLPALGNWLRSNRVRSAAGLLATHIRMARSAAIATSTTGSLDVAPDGLSYTYPDLKGNAVTHTLPEGVTIVTTTPDPVDFGSGGSLDGATSATVEVEGPVTDGMGHRYTIDVSRIGKITVSKSEVSL